MIITCNNCNKKFELDSSLIPEKGRLLQCNGCNHQWFFKKKNINKLTTPIKIHEPTELTDSIQTSFTQEPKSIDEKLHAETETMELLDKIIENDPVREEISIKDITKTKEDSNIKKDSVKKNKYNILSLTIVFIISFVALIIVLDTFQVPISKTIPNIEFILYNLYETINDIELFFRDLI